MSLLRPKTAAAGLTFPIQLEREGIEQLLTLRGPALLINGATIVNERTVEAWYQFPPKHPCFEGHWPGHPIVPSYLMPELVGHTASLLLIYLGAENALNLVPVFRYALYSVRGNIYPDDKVGIRARLIANVNMMTNGVMRGIVFGDVSTPRYPQPVSHVKIQFEVWPRQQLFPNNVA